MFPLRRCHAVSALSRRRRTELRGETRMLGCRAPEKPSKTAAREILWAEYIDTVVAQIAFASHESFAQLL